MTDRLRGFTVVLESDIREDDAEPILQAIAQLRGVVAVEPVVAGPDDRFAELRVKRELAKVINNVLRSNP